ncbi:MAG: DUF962 domain-containing protein [Gammaproteobacteria bacterium]|nr:DUF962 domain-containing protein [Gammaproteobacteria bacterium]NNC98438.1 DUF962 domain-containing protein [Gammaproteobacteria bacterium]NNM14745.1 DUF962 domain-containing protein [Gammaproteobacteria bacterium]
MRSIDQWLQEYGESHQNPTNKLIHWFCVPLIVLSVIGLFWSIPVPEAMSNISPWLNFGTLLILLALIYYTFLSIKLSIGMLLYSALTVLVIQWLNGLELALWKSSLGIFVVAWIVQFIGHEIEGKKPSFLKDIQFLMIGPIWLLSFLYKKAGIKI